MVISFLKTTSTRRDSLSFRVFSALVCLSLLVSACGTSDAERLKNAREDYVKDDFAKAESELFTPEVFKNAQNRLEHFYFLSSVSMAEGQFEKAIYFLNRSREIANQVRSSSGTFEWFSKDYKSNPIEYSYIHYMLVMCYSLLAQAKEIPAWSMPEIKDDKGNVMVSAESHPARTLSGRDVADYRQKARSELMAWDSFLQDLKRTYPTQNFYKEDMWARMLASFVHGISSDDNERRTAELLTGDAKNIFDHVFSQYPSTQSDSAQVTDLINRLKVRAQGKADNESLFVVEAGILPPYKIKRFVIGLSTIFSGIKDPGLRRSMEMVGMQVLLNFAPEFGLIAVGGAVAGAVGGKADDEEDGPPQYFSDAVDRSFGFEIRFPSMIYPPADTHVKLRLTAPGKTSTEYALPIVSPVQEIIANEMKAREGSEMLAKATAIGAQYVAVLVPAVIAYRNAGRRGNILEKLGILAGYFIAKKAIDAANSPDLRSWSMLPQIIAADLINVPAGSYDAKVTLQNRFGREEKSLGLVDLGSPNSMVVKERLGNVAILNHRDDEGLPIRNRRH